MRVAEGAVKSGLMEAMHSRKPVSKEERVAASSKLASSRICKEGSCKGEEVEMEKCSLGLWKQCIHGNQSQKRRVAASSKVASRRICIEREGLKGRSEVRVDGSDAFTETSLERRERCSFFESGFKEDLQRRELKGRGG